MNSSAGIKSIHPIPIPLKISSILIVAEWSPLTLSNDAFTRMCDLDSREASSDEDNDEEQCSGTLTVTRKVKINKILIEMVLFVKSIMNFCCVSFQCHYHSPSICFENHILHFIQSLQIVLYIIRFLFAEIRLKSITLEKAQHKVINLSHK